MISEFHHFYKEAKRLLAESQAQGANDKERELLLQEAQVTALLAFTALTAGQPQRSN